MHVAEGPTKFEISPCYLLALLSRPHCRHLIRQFWTYQQKTVADPAQQHSISSLNAEGHPFALHTLECIFFSKGPHKDRQVLQGHIDEGFSPTRQQFICATVNRAAREATDFCIFKLQLAAVQRYLDECLEEQRRLSAAHQALRGRARIAAVEHKAAQDAYKAAVQALLDGVQNSDQAMT
ncbi:hypothetical protein DUNSADRAFT_17584 [Dunaliella salina]|uniref:Uncharacterized protein n=1 Tax=Dunaliella salina TaxID=3046 RepID=A0ABQ7G1H9_DUNSA|nr:hypothetical protein DUNSADRAFT_17584 [Dunaliella salina]|eukprot:KAF5828455.1 hypothetical protein DUNSADRAFT_17584 [Dunaliella salina]